MRAFGNNLITWSDQHFVIQLYDCGPAGEPGRRWIGYKVHDYAYDPVVPLIFEGDDYQVGMGTDSGSVNAVLGLAHFCSLKPGDTDKEYFKDYTERQLAWRDSARCDDLSMLVMEFESVGEHG